MSFAVVTSAICALGFAALFLFTLARGKPSREGRFVLAASAATASWAALTALGAAPGVAQPLETIQSLIWLALLERLLRPQAETGWSRSARSLAVVTGALAGIVALANDLMHVGGETLVWSQIVARAGMAIAGLLLVENLYRNIEPKRLWNVVPLCIGIGGFFAYGLFLYSTALLTGHVNPLFAEARPAATCLSAPFLALTLARNRDWRIDHHLSRSLVFHTFTLVVSGVFLLVVASLGLVLQQAGGAWGPAAQIVALFGSILVLALVLSSGGIKARINYLVSRNFFSLRYDYRIEWMNFIDILSAPGDGVELRQRVVHAVANIVDSPRGALWLVDEGVGFRPAAFFDLHLPPELVEPLSSAFIAGFRGGHWIQVLDGETNPAPWRAHRELWLAVPLVHSSRMIGFIVLAHPRAPLDLNWESFDLLRAIGRQAASYVCEESAAQQLADARRLEDYGKRFAFLGHDLKSIASQLRLIAVNVRRHGDDPAFRADAFRTVEQSAARMNALLLQLNARTAAAKPSRVVPADAARIVAEVANALAGAGAPIETRMPASAAPVAMSSEDLRSALTHIVSNAIEASPADAAVNVTGSLADGRLAIEVTDRGPGMDHGFIHDELFRPFRTTKAGGTGIGAYQTRELVRAAGGELDVISRPGAGTTMRIVLPLAREGAVPSAA
ncbi:MAG: PEP-CTERM system histidine kinase PrsK [Alphaproteobacteria bacterium]|nr:PEP-CTERM system histidine kinase PrsK [Alphaproteobacteria bacterium]